MKVKLNIEAKFDKRKYLLSFAFLLGGIVYFLLGWLIDFSWETRIIISLTALVIILFSVRILADITDNRVQLIINERGLYWRRFQDAFIPWDNIACVTRYSLYQGRYIGVLLKDSPLFKEGNIKTEVQQVHKPLRFYLTFSNVAWFGAHDPAKIVNDDRLTGEDFIIPDTLNCGFGRISLAINDHLEESEKFQSF